MRDLTSVRVLRPRHESYLSLELSTTAAACEEFAKASVYYRTTVVYTASYWGHYEWIFAALREISSAARDISQFPEV